MTPFSGFSKLPRDFAYKTEKPPKRPGLFEVGRTWGPQGGQAPEVTVPDHRLNAVYLMDVFRPVGAFTQANEAGSPVRSPTKAPKTQVF